MTGFSDHAFDAAMDALLDTDPYSPDAPDVPLRGFGPSRAASVLPTVALGAASSPETLSPASGLTRDS